MKRDCKNFLNSRKERAPQQWPVNGMVHCAACWLPVLVRDAADRHPTAAVQLDHGRDGDEREGAGGRSRTLR